MNKAEFKHIFDTYFDAIRSFIYYRTSDEDTASDLAQDVFVRVWEKHEGLFADNIKSLLYKIASDMVVSHYRKSSVRFDYAKNMRVDGQSETPQDQMQFNELKTRYSQALSEMSEDHRTTFLMSREEDLKYTEIAERLGVSVKAIEKRMSVALQILRTKLL